jgi:hypothetical protein
MACVSVWKTKNGLGPKSLRGNMFYKGHIEIAEKASHHFKKAPISLTMYLKGLAILEKASIYLKKSSKIIEIFIKAKISKQKLPLLWNVFWKLLNLYKSLTFLKKKSLHFFENIFKKPQNLSKRSTFI